MKANIVPKLEAKWWLTQKDKDVDAEPLKGVLQTYETRKALLLREISIKNYRDLIDALNEVVNAAEYQAEVCRKQDHRNHGAALKKYRQIVEPEKKKLIDARAKYEKELKEKVVEVKKLLESTKGPIQRLSRLDKEIAELMKEFPRQCRDGKGPV